MGKTGPIAALLVLAALWLSAGDARTQLKGTMSSKGRNPAQSVHLQSCTDSLSPARGDTLQNVADRRVNDETPGHVRDPIADARRVDSLGIGALRKIPNRAFGVGERLVFDVSYGIITAGEAVMAISSIDAVAGRDCYHVQFTVNSLPSFSWIYRVDDHYSTFIDTESIAPWKFEQHIREGSYRRDFIASFDQIHHVAVTTEGEHPIPPYVHDIMSAFYYTRTRDFSSSKVGDVITLHNFFKDTTYELGVKFLGRQELEVKAGTFRSIVVEPLVKEGGLFKSEGRIVIWLTDDERKIPIRVNTKVLIGSIDTELREYSGLVGPVQARVR